jgi:DNA-binding CsgD family transcriptional regulator
MLHSLGLDETAQSVYRFVLERQGCCVADVADAFTISEDAANTAIKTLTDLRLLRRLAGSLTPGSPSAALQSLLQRQQEELLRKQQEFNETRAAANRLIAEYEEVCGLGVRNEWERFDGIVAVEARMEILTRQAKGEILLMAPAGTQSTFSLTARKPLDQELLSSGVSIATIFQDCVYNDRVTMRYADWLARVGGQVATAPTLPMWMLIVDRSIALLPVEPESGCCSAFQVTGAGILTALSALFESAWTSATPLGSTRTTIDDEPSNIERELLRLLGQGLTDEACCKKLGIGLRTVRRMVADLMHKLDARSRFEAGANAAHCGWLEPRRGCPTPRTPEPRHPNSSATEAVQHPQLSGLAAAQ